MAHGRDSERGGQARLGGGDGEQADAVVVDPHFGEPPVELPFPRAIVTAREQPTAPPSRNGQSSGVIQARTCASVKVSIACRRAA